MSTISLLDPRLRIALRRDVLVVERDGEVLDHLRLADVELIQLHAHADVTPHARVRLLREGVDVVWVDARGKVLGRSSSFASRWGERRTAQYAVTSDAAARLKVARPIIAAKITNQRNLLLARQRHLKDPAIGDALAAMRSLEARVPEAGDPDTLRGLEGAAAAAYFGAFGRAVTNAAFSFQARNRRPPRDPINAMLSFGYALLLIRVEQATHRAGLDAWLGVLHTPGRGAPALALDLAEPWRPLVDGLVLTLVNRRQVSPEDFRHPGFDDLDDEDGEPLPDDACWLDTTGRAVLVAAFERRLLDTAPHPERDAMWTHKDLILEQARQFARVCEGETATFRPPVLP